jgi:hypothetical protein
MIAPPYTIFVDESGTPICRAAGQPDSHEGYVVAAVAVPVLSVPFLHSILPRNSAGQILKFSDRELTPKVLAYFVEQVLFSDVELCLAMLETTSPKNRALSGDLVTVSNQRRAARHNPAISQASMVYLQTAGEAILGALSQLSRRRGPASGFIDVTLDEGNVSQHDRPNIVTALKQDCTRCGFDCRDVTWTTEQAQPMLFVPDILAGIYRRQVTHRDVNDALFLMEGALAARRIMIRDGITTLDPQKLKEDYKVG